MSSKKKSAGPINTEQMEDLVASSLILAQHGVLDAFGHVSIRHPADPERYLLSRNLAPELVTSADIVEYDSPRAGNFQPLRAVPTSKRVVLGLVSTKAGTLEKLDDLKARVDEAGRFVDIDRLAVSPQCGFASVETGNPLSEAEQEAKLRLVVDLARAVWGEA